MFQEVDVIGIESVVSLIQRSKLTKFMIFRKGSGKGSIPVYEAMYCDSNAKCIQAFRDWGNSALNMNPGNIMPYEILLYSKNASDADLENDMRYEQNAPKDEAAAARRKENKIKFSFALNGIHSPQQYPGFNPQGSQQQPVNVAEEIRRALDLYKKEQDIKELKERIKELEDGDDEDSEGSGMVKFTNLLREVRLGTKKKGVAVAGDNDDDEDDSDDDDADDQDDDDADDSDDDDTDDQDDDDAEDTKTAKKSSGNKKSVLKKRKRLKDALNILLKQDANFIPHLEKLARLSKKNPAMFKTVLSNLDALNI